MGIKFTTRWRHLPQTFPKTVKVSCSLIALFDVLGVDLLASGRDTRNIFIFRKCRGLPCIKNKCKKQGVGIWFQGVQIIKEFKDGTEIDDKKFLGSNPPPSGYTYPKSPKH